MPWRLIGLVLLLVIFLTFIGLNLENRCNISFGFRTLEEVPVYFTAFAGFVLGLLWAVPFAISLSRKRKKKEKDAALPPDLAEALAKVDELAGPSPRQKKRGKKGDDSSYNGNGGPYGID
jgi:uncharacterized integral membrane protein